MNYLFMHGNKLGNGAAAGLERMFKCSWILTNFMAFLWKRKWMAHQMHFSVDKREMPENHSFANWHWKKLCRSGISMETQPLRKNIRNHNNIRTINRYKVQSDCTMSVWTNRKSSTRINSLNSIWCVRERAIDTFPCIELNLMRHLFHWR